MNEIEHEGKTYILKSNVENIIKERVSKVASRASEAEARATDLESQIKTMQKKQANVDVLTNQISELKNQLETSNNKFNRYQSISKLGITDGEIIDLLEYSYDKAMQSKDSKERVELHEWLNEHMSDIDNAPKSIKPFLQEIRPEPVADVQASEQVQNEAHNALEALQAQEPVAEQPMMNQNAFMTPPAVNKGAIRSPDSKNILQRAMTDQNFYNQNAQAVRDAWFAKFKK